MKRALIAVCLAAIAPVAASAWKSDRGPTDVPAVPLQGGELPPGPNFALYKASCLTCHTSSYVIQLPKTTRDVWEASVKKMVDLYDAPISEANQKLIVDYLMSVR